MIQKTPPRDMRREAQDAQDFAKAPWRPFGCDWDEIIIEFYLVGGIPTPLKNMKVSWGYYSQHMGK
jgi:hypothetical protein